MFTGEGFSGSLDAFNGTAYLSHEPTAGLDIAEGCCGGTGSVNRYVLLAPEPGMLGLLALGLVGLAAGRRRGG